PYDWLIAALPSPQAADLLVDAPTLRSEALACPMVACWALMMRFDAPLPVSFDAAFVAGSSLTWIARNDSKPGRHPSACWVLHAAREWSDVRCEQTPEAVVAPMLAEFARVLGRAVSPATAQAHRWRYSGPVGKAEVPCLVDLTRRAGACGDWLAGARVEGAFQSAVALAERMISAGAPG
ncbi:MAG: FAD-dependent oxidoreductase, partial [Proteobacteria bacterium]|nr:FAD-dependent oxidoreductase [Burkholderiales bacterium]